jgi:hypothetical protein
MGTSTSEICMAGFAVEQDSLGARRNCTRETCHFLPTHNSPKIKAGPITPYIFEPKDILPSLRNSTRLSLRVKSTSHKLQYSLPTEVHELDGEIEKEISSGNFSFLIIGFT